MTHGFEGAVGALSSAPDATHAAPVTTGAGRNGSCVARSGAAVAPQDLHDAIFARQFRLLNPLLLEVLLRGEEVLVLQRRQPFLQLQVLLVVAAQFRIPI